MVPTNTSPNMVGITAVAVGGMVVAGMVAPLDVKVVAGIAAAKAVDAKVEVVVAMAVATPGDPRLVVLPHPRSEAAAEGADRRQQRAQIGEGGRRR